MSTIEGILAALSLTTLVYWIVAAIVIAIYARNSR